MRHSLRRAFKLAEASTTSTPLPARDGSSLTLQVDTICVHGDTPGAAELAAAVRLGLEQAGITVAALAP